MRFLFTRSLAALAVAATAAVGITLPAAAAGVNYVALGDSYSSGVGAGDYLDSSGDCLRSENAYSAAWAAQNAPASYRSVACSGARTGDVLANQISALSGSTTLVSITVGGIDAGFSDIIKTCVLEGEGACIGAVQAAEDTGRAELPGKLDTTYGAIRSAAPSAQVVVLSYPEFYELGHTFCVGLSEKSRTKINEGINVIDGVINAAAARAGFVFGDVRGTFDGHQLCSGSKWLHALNVSDLTVSYHPFESGQRGGYLPVFTAAAG